MKNIRRALFTSALAIAACGIASAGSITQTFNLPGGSSLTNWTTTINPNSYSFLQNGLPSIYGTLNSVTVTYSWAVTGTGAATDNNATTTGGDNFTYEVDTRTSLWSGTSTSSAGAISLFENTGLGIGVGDTSLGNNGTGCVDASFGIGKATGQTMTETSCVDSSAIEALSGNTDNAQLTTTVSSGTAFNYFTSCSTATCLAFVGKASTLFQVAGPTNTSSPLANAVEAVSITYNYSAPVTGTPEPATMFLMGSALVGVGLLRKRIKA